MVQGVALLGGMALLEEVCHWGQACACTLRPELSAVPPPPSLCHHGLKTSESREEIKHILLYVALVTVSYHSNKKLTEAGVVTHAFSPNVVD